MKIKFIVILVLIVFFQSDSNGQISLSPEIGVSYLPFTLYGANNQKESARIDYLFGIAAQLPIHNKWYINSAISYVDREDIMWTDLCTCPGYLYSEFRHYDINFDFTALRRLNRNINFGLGPSFIMKTEEWEFKGEPPYPLNRVMGQNEWLYGLHVSVSARLMYNINVNLKYIRYLNEIDYFFKVTGSNRVDLTVSYTLGSDNRASR